MRITANKEAKFLRMDTRKGKSGFDYHVMHVLDGDQVVKIYVPGAKALELPELQLMQTLKLEIAVWYGTKLYDKVELVKLIA